MPEKSALSSILMPVIPKNLNNPFQALIIPSLKPSFSTTIKEAAVKGSGLQYENKRFQISPRQAVILENYFYNYYHQPSDYDIRRLSLQIQGEESFVKNWFRNKRYGLIKKNNSSSNN